MKADPAKARVTDDPGKRPRRPGKQAPHPVPMQWVNAPQQARSQKTLERLLDAAEQIIRERGLDGVTIPEVVKAAGSSVGSFYARFADKSALLETLHERACVQSIATAELALDPARWEGADTAEVVSAIVAFAVQIYGARRTVMNAFNQAFAGDPGFAARRARSAVALAKIVTRLLLSRRSAIGHDDPSLAIAMAMRAVTATLEQRNAFDVAGVAALRVRDEALSTELVRMVKAYLVIP